MELNPATGELILAGPHEIGAGLFCLGALEQYHGHLPRSQAKTAQSAERKLMAAQQQARQQGNDIRVLFTPEETKLINEGAENGSFSPLHRQRFNILPGYTKDAVDEIRAQADAITQQ